MPKGKMDVEKIGQWSFIIGVVIAILAGLLGMTSPNVPVLLMVLGIIVGLLNISETEIYNFLIAAIALLLSGVARLENLPVVGAIVGPILANITTFVAPAVVIVALKAIFDLGQKK
ncbi:MAG: hypothetical protein ACP5E4_01130 [Candidatus Aenigmatarchaeota archaeon]